MLTSTYYIYALFDLLEEKSHLALKCEAMLSFLTAYNFKIKDNRVTMVAMQPNKNDQNALKGMPSIDGVRPMAEPQTEQQQPQAQPQSEPQTLPEQPNPVPIEDQPSPVVREPKLRKKRFPIVAVILAIIIVAGLAGAAFMLGIRQNLGQEGSSPRTTGEDTPRALTETVDEKQPSRTKGSPVININ